MRLLGPALNGVSSGLYRGLIEVRVDGGGVTSINQLSMDSYIRGVVAGEMPSSWPLEALKVQAVAARTYALATAKTSGAFDQYPDTRSQVYRGVTGESVSSDAAVRDTAGQIVTYNGDAGGDLLLLDFRRAHGERGVLFRRLAVEALARGGSGSRTTACRPITAGPCASRRVRSTAPCARPGAFRRVRALERGVSPRVVRAKVVGTTGSRRAHRASDPGRARAPRHVVHRLPRRGRGGAVALGTPGELGTAAARSGAGRAVRAGAAEARAASRAPRGGRPLAFRGTHAHVSVRALPRHTRALRCVPRGARRGEGARRPRSLSRPFSSA